MKIKSINGRSVTLFMVGLATIGFLLYYIVINSVASQAKANRGKPYFWCAAYKNGVAINRYCYGDTGGCQTYNLYNKDPGAKKGGRKVNRNDTRGDQVTYSCYSERVYVRRKGAPCPPDDYVIEIENGGSIGCFGGFKETNKKIIKKI